MKVYIDPKPKARIEIESIKRLTTSEMELKRNLLNQSKGRATSASSGYR
jgi:hypothetical protein